ncbi:multidrug resistance-associated protein 4-like [Agrilus planipennis]|uniref:Multidrug resistance-associated protein 4-like n=1 Tax=Agrilus planipennis TaxID=224129 RepID=A0A7F5R2K4_AGRPL|nr:multidrug resistance-associated protein 4-like [Agrilus planipennis]
MENQHLGMQMRVAVCSLIYRKSLKLNQSAFEEVSTGQLVNLLSNDVDRFDSLLLHIHSLWLCPVEIVIIIILIYFHVGFTATLGSIFLVIFLPIQICLGKRISLYRLRTALRTDERVRLMGEIISGINVIKMYSWECYFMKLVKFIRRKEIDEISAVSFIKGITLAIRMFATRTSIFLCIVAYLLSGNEINARYVFVVTSYYNILRKTLILQFPSGIREFAEGSISIERVQRFLLFEETEQTNKNNKTNNNNSLSNTITANKTLDENSNKPHVELVVRILLKNVSAKWPSSAKIKNTLSNVNLEVTKNELVAVVGNVGSGKTSLLNVILRELKILDGHIDVQGKVSYAPQEPWFFSGTIKQNITFGSGYNEKRYRDVLKVCALEKDIMSFPNGDRTLLGERGVTLSGGQRARINLARALYREADIYLLDDPLSAVDTEVGKHLFEKGVTEFLKNKCVVLVTHQLQYLRNVNRIIVMEEGTITFQGAYQDLQRKQLCLTKDTQKLDKEGCFIEQGMLETTLFSAVTKKISENNESASETKESKNIGKISAKDYLTYIKSGGSLAIAILILLMFLITQGSSSGADYFVTFWVNVEQDRKSQLKNDTLSGIMEYIDRNGLSIFGTIVSLNVLLSISSTFLFYWYCMKASKKLHHKMFSHIVYAKMIFFNLNPSGRILNRFSKDMGNIDEKLPDVLVDLIQMGLSILGTITVIIIVNHWIVIVAAAMLILFYFLRKFYLSTSLSIKRLEGVTRSPVYTHLNASLQGLSTIRAFGAEEALTSHFDEYQNLNSSATYLSIACTRAFGFWLDMICAMFITSVTFSFLMMKNVKYSGNIGLAITQASGLTKMFQKCIRQWSDLDNQMISVERVTEYMRIEKEFEPGASVPNDNWPSEGNIKFKSVCLRYSPTTPWVLKDLNLSIRAKEKVGIVGRTGAGKSSLICALFQLCENTGQIIIDDVDISTVPLNYLRSKISIIPQEPVLFSGTVRKNLDPFGEYSDVVLWNALEQVELKQVVIEQGLGLDSKISEGGSNFSVGQRQLFCLARAIIRNNKILVLDEATASVDQQTDLLIQKTIRKRFADCTVLTIAHRLHTIMDSSRILVLEDGAVAEYDHPHVLLQNPSGSLYRFVDKTGSILAKQLQELAKEAYDISQSR